MSRSDAEWSGMCPSGQHGLDYRGQSCDLCPLPPFAVWRQEGPDHAVHVVQAPSAQQAAEQRAREEARQDPSWQAPVTYRVRDGGAGQIWDVIVDLVHEPTFVAFDTHEVKMRPATHVLWGGNVLCEDLRLRHVPCDWPKDQHWISLKAVADGAARPANSCATCWDNAPGLVEALLQIGKHG